MGHTIGLDKRIVSSVSLKVSKIYVLTKGSYHMSGYKGHVI